MIAADPPSATVHWLSYRDEWVYGLGISLVVTTVGFLFTDRLRTSGITIEADRRLEKRRLVCLAQFSQS